MISHILITLFLVLLNGFFVAAEFAIVKVRASQIEIRAQAGSSAAKLSSFILSNLDGYLAATQLGITLASLGLGWVGEPVVSKLILKTMALFGVVLNPELSHQIALPIAFAVITVLHIVFGELAPKSIAIQRAESTTMLIAYPLNVFYWVFKPFIWVLNGFAGVILKVLGVHAIHGSEVHSSDELKYLIQQSSESGDLEPSNYDIIKNAFDFNERTAKQILVPRNQVVALDIATFDEKSIDNLLEEGYSRIPCYETDIDNIVGILYLKDVLTKLRKKEPIKIKELIKPMIIIPETRKIGGLLKEFQQRHIHLAAVVNEFGGLKGIVTMEDIIEELVGEIQDEHDNEALIVEKMDDVTYKVIATAGINDINNLLPFPIENEKQFDTLAGIIMGHYGRIPATNDNTIIGRYEMTVIKKVRNTVNLVQLKLIAEA